MSIINVRATTNLTAALAYQKGKDGHRAAYSTSSCDPLDFLSIAKELQAGTKVEGYTFVQSFSSNELDVNNPDDVLRAHQAGVEFFSELADRFGVMFNVETHVDSKGGCVHNHGTIANVDLRTGKALQGKVKLWQYLTVLNDSVMRDMGLEVCNEPKQQGYDYKADLEQRLDASIAASSTYDEFVLSAAARGIVVNDKKKNGYYRKNITYVFEDAEGVQHKVRDYSLSDGYTRDAVTKQIQQQMQQMPKLDESLAPHQQYDTSESYEF